MQIKFIYSLDFKSFKEMEKYLNSDVICVAHNDQSYIYNKEYKEIISIKKVRKILKEERLYHLSEEFRNKSKRKIDVGEGLEFFLKAHILYEMDGWTYDCPECDIDLG